MVSAAATALAYPSASWLGVRIPIENAHKGDRTTPSHRTGPGSTIQLKWVFGVETDGPATFETRHSDPPAANIRVGSELRAYGSDGELLGVDTLR
jgi:hypothetical protein